MTDDPAKRHDDEAADADLDGGFKVDIPEDLLDEAEEAVDRRVAEGQSATSLEDGLSSDDPFDDPTLADGVEDGAEEQAEDHEGVVFSEESVEFEATDSGEAPDLESMSVDDVLASGLVPDQLVTAFNEERARVFEAKGAEKEARDKMLAQMAESENFRRRVTREKNDAIKFANEDVIKEILPVFDNLERALQFSGDTDTGGNIREGVEITLRQFLHVFQKIGLTRVAAEKGEPFDPQVHEAVAQVATSDVPANSIAEVLQGGFLLHERLLRPAMVSVAKSPAPAAEPEPAGSPADRSEPEPVDSSAGVSEPELADSSGAASEPETVDSSAGVSEPELADSSGAASEPEPADSSAAASEPEPAAEASDEEAWPDEVAAAREAGEESGGGSESAESAVRGGDVSADSKDPAAQKKLPTPSFADGDLDDWESSVEAVRTDKSS